MQPVIFHSTPVLPNSQEEADEIGNENHSTIYPTGQPIYPWHGLLLILPASSPSEEKFSNDFQEPAVKGKGNFKTELTEEHSIPLAIRRRQSFSSTDGNYLIGKVLGFTTFCRLYRNSVNQKYPNEDSRKCTEILGDWWLALNPDERKKYERLENFHSKKRTKKQKSSNSKPLENPNVTLAELRNANLQRRPPQGK